MPFPVAPSPHHADCGISLRHFKIADNIVVKYCKMQPGSRHHDDISSAGLEALMKIYSHYDEARLTDSLVAISVRNMIINVLRKECNSALLLYRPEEVDAIEEGVWEEARNIHDSVVLGERSDWLSARLNSTLLNAREKTVISLMRKVEFQSDAARILGIGEATVSRNMDSAATKLRGASFDKLLLA